jgi:23S rRNA (guanosine2251-2'-O)-methyltransferase
MAQNKKDWYAGAGRKTPKKDHFEDRSAEPYGRSGKPMHSEGRAYGEWEQQRGKKSPASAEGRYERKKTEGGKGYGAKEAPRKQYAPDRPYGKGGEKYYKDKHRREEQEERRSYQPRQPEQPQIPESTNEPPLIVFGRNPVKEAIKAGRSIDKIFVVDNGSEDGSLRELVRMGREAGLVIAEVSRSRLDEMTLPYGYAGKPANHQGIIAQLPEVEYVSVSDIIDKAKESGRVPFVLVLDSILDPHNLGSIIRTAECAGAHGIIIPKRRSASVTAAAAKASAGAVLHASVARVSNLAGAIEMLKENGFWVAGAEAEGANMYECKLDGPLALVIGSEGEGISRLLKEKCDFLVSIPLLGQVTSLNASVAAGVLMYEKLRQDGLKK